MIGCLRIRNLPHLRLMYKRMMTTARHMNLGNGSVYKVQTLGKEDLQFTEKIISVAALQGNNVGLDEFTTEAIQGHLERTEVISVRSVDHATTQLPALLLLYPSPTNRRLPPIVGQFNVMIPEVAGVAHVRDVTRLAVRIGAERKSGYIGLLTSVFTSCDVIRKGLAQEDFVETAKFPSMGIHRGKEEDTILYYRRFTDDELQEDINFKTDPKACEILGDSLCQHLPDPSDDTSTPPPVPSLLQPIRFQHNGIDIIARNPTREDGPIIYQHILQVANQGQGFSLGCYPIASYKLFYYKVLLSMSGVVFETTDGRFIYYSVVGPCVYTRSTRFRFRFGRNLVMMNPEFQGKKLFGRLQDVAEEKFVELGYQGTINATPVTNLPLVAAARTAGFTEIGRIPARDVIDGKPMDSAVAIKKFHSNKL